jgi:ribosomal protein S18 acetylase RimI-like enzyme
MVHVRAAAPRDGAWIRALLEERWGGQEQVVSGEPYRPADLPGFIAVLGGEPVGYAALRIVDDTAEIGLIDAVRERVGVGSALVRALAEAAGNAGCSTLRAVTTNDNRGAMALYEALGFELTAVREHAVTESRKVKPQIPLEGHDGTPITDEWVYELPLGPASS